MLVSLFLAFLMHLLGLSFESCSEGDVRLEDGELPNEGRVEICLGEQWGAVCDDGWGATDARVVCRQLGLPAQYAQALYRYTRGSLGYHYEGFQCSGIETALADCPVERNVSLYQVIDCSQNENAGVKCTNVSCNESAVQLNGAEVVEVCYNQVWGLVCAATGWGSSAARVLCTEVRLLSSRARSGHRQKRHYDAPVVLNNILCTGNERSIMECSGATYGNFSQCSDVAVAQCEAREPCSGVNTLRLTESSSDRVGRLEICSGGMWGTVCGTTTTNAVAQVACRQLNHAAEGSLRTEQSLEILLSGLVPVLITNIACTGLEQNISECSFDGPPGGDFGCSHYDDVILFCTSRECNEVDVRFVSGGRVEICLNGLWGSVCDDRRDSREAAVVCRQLNHNDSTTVKGYVNAGVLPVFPSDVQCSRIVEEPRLCRVRETTSAECIVAGISCGDNSTMSPTPVVEKVTMADGLGGTVLGVLLSALLLLVITISSILLAVYLKRRKKRHIELMQLDIMPAHYKNRAMSPEKCEVQEVKDEPIDKELSTTTQSNTYMNDVLECEHENRPRVSSHHSRALTYEKLIIKREDITLLGNIGEGEFGIVYRALLKRRMQQVAVKTLKVSFSQLEVNKFVEESVRMSRFKHANVMGLIGICLDSGNAPLIVMPFMENGSLLYYLKRERNNLILSGGSDEDEVKEVCKRLIAISCQIASGMEYLAAEKYIHRDLAARNCLIDENFLIKITDFGLSEDVFERNYFRQGSSESTVKFPVKWMAPESLSDGYFSEKSDVWSYGVTIWEIFSGGMVPYPGTTPFGLLEMLKDGERLPKPYNAACTEEIYMMMRKCWEKDPCDRPSFKDLHSSTSKLIARIAGYLELGYNPFCYETKSTEPETEQQYGENHD